MTLELTEQQRETLARGHEAMIVPTNTDYVLVRADIVERLKNTLLEGFQPAEAYPAIDRAFSEGWNAPGMDDYDRYEELKR